MSTSAGRAPNVRLSPPLSHFWFSDVDVVANTRLFLKDLVSTDGIWGYTSSATATPNRPELGASGQEPAHSPWTQRPRSALHSAFPLGVAQSAITHSPQPLKSLASRCAFRENSAWSTLELMAAPH